jgi:hypothetical protein
MTMTTRPRRTKITLMNVGMRTSPAGDIRTSTDMGMGMRMLME